MRMIFKSTRRLFTDRQIQASAGIFGHIALPAGITRLSGLLVYLILLAGCSNNAAPPRLDLSTPATQQEIHAVTEQNEISQDSFRFGFDLRNGAKEDAQQYLPLLKYLQQNTGYRFSLHITENSEQLVEDLAGGRLHFAAIGAGSYLTANNTAPILPLVRGVNSEGEAGYRSILVVAPDNQLQSVRELKGKHLAFGSPTSTQGHWIPRIMLHEAGLELANLKAYFYTRSHRDCAEAVISDKADACGLQDTLALRLIRMGLLRQLAVSDLYPSSGVFAHAGVPVEVRSAVQQALISFDPQAQHRTQLYNWDATEMAGGYVVSSPDDYEPLRAWALKLGLLDANAAAGESP